MLDVEQRSGVAVVRLRHGKVNALDLELLQAITAAMRDVDQSAAVVITGTATAFSAGVDLQRILAGGPSYVQEFLPALSAAFMAIFDHPGPVLAAVNGHAIAGGCVIAAACDVRLMSPGKIGLAELSVGSPSRRPRWKSSGTWPARPPVAWCSPRRCSTRRRLSRSGWSTRVGQPDALLDAVLDQARRWRGSRPTCSRSASASCSGLPGSGSPRGAATRTPSSRCGRRLRPGMRLAGTSTRCRQRPR